MVDETERCEGRGCVVMGVMERDELEERWGSAEEDGGERSVVVVSVTEMRVGD